MKFGVIDSVRTVTDVLSEVFDRNFSEDIVRWMGECPTGPNRWYAAFDGDKPIAIYGMMPIIVEIYDCRHVGSLCNNGGVIPAYRNKGVFTELGRYAINDMRPDIVIGVTNADAAPGHRKVGWKKFGVLELLSGETTRAWKEIRQFDQRDFRYFPTFNRMPVNGHPRFMVVRGEAFMKWRYSKPGPSYYQSVFPDRRYVIWKEHVNGHKQVMETNSWETITNLGGDVDVWQFKDTKVSDYLKGLKFKSVLDGDFILHTKLNVDYDLNKFRFELADNDSF